MSEIKHQLNNVYHKTARKYSNKRCFEHRYHPNKKMTVIISTFFENVHINVYTTKRYDMLDYAGLTYIFRQFHTIQPKSTKILFQTLKHLYRFDL